MEWWVEGQNLHHWEYKESVFYLQVNIQTACIVFWHFKMGASWYPESFFNEFFWHQDPSMLEGFFFSWLPGYKDTCKVTPGCNNMMSPALIKKQVLCWWRNWSGQFLRKELSVLPRLPLHSSSIIYRGLHHSTPQMSLWCSNSWDVYRHTINFSTQKISGHVAVLQVWKYIPLVMP